MRNKLIVKRIQDYINNHTINGVYDIQSNDGYFISVEDLEEAIRALKICDKIN